MPHMKIEEIGIGEYGDATHVLKHAFKKSQTDMQLENSAKSICGNNNWKFVGMKSFNRKRITVFFKKMTTVEIMERSCTKTG